MARAGWSAVRGLFASASSPVDPYGRSDYWNGVPYFAGVRMDVDTALQLSAVWACIDAITKAIAPSPWRVIARDSERRRRVLYDDSLAYLLNVRPNPDMTAVGFREALMFCALSYGNGYAEIVRDGAGRIAELWPLHPDTVTARRRDREGGFRLFYEHRGDDGLTVDLNPRDIFHLHGPGLTGLMGDNIVTRAARSLSLAAAKERFASSYFGNNTQLGGVIEYPGKLGETNMQAMTASWKAAHQGPDKAHKPAILENGAKYVPFTATAEASQLIEATKFSIEDIARWFGVPPHKIGHLDRATFNNIEHLGIEWVRDGLTPWAQRLEQEADYKLLPPRSAARETKLDLKWLSHGDAASRASYLQTMWGMGAMSLNEVREFEGMNDIGVDGDRRVMPLNYQTLRQLDIAEKTAAKTLDAGAAPAVEPDEDSGSATEPDEQGHLSPAARVRTSMVSLFASVLETCIPRDVDAFSYYGTPRILDVAADAVAAASRIRGEPIDLSEDLTRAVDDITGGRTTARSAAEAIVAKVLAVRRVAA